MFTKKLGGVGKKIGTRLNTNTPHLHSIPHTITRLYNYTSV